MASRKVNLIPRYGKEEKHSAKGKKSYDKVFMIISYQENCELDFM